MSMKQFVISPEINMDDILLAMIEDLGVDDLVVFVEELMERVADQDFNHELYELMRRNHDQILESMGVTEAEYQTDYAPVVYGGIEASVAEDNPSEDDFKDEPEEVWETEPVDDLEEENPMDVFTTEDDK